MPVIGPIVSTLTGPQGLPTVIGAGFGIVLAPIGVAAFRQNVWDPGEQWAPALNIVAGGAMFSLAKMIPIKFVNKMALGLLIGPIAVFAADMIRIHLLPAIGLGDFVTLPYMGYGDYMTLPYAGGYGDQAAIEAGNLGAYGDQAAIEAGDLGSFGGDPSQFYAENRTF